MKRTLPLLLLLAAALPVAAQDKDTFDRVEARVTSYGPVVIDRGSSDGVKAGDRVFFYPRGGETYLGTVVEVDERSSTVEVRAAVVPAPGTRAEVLVPRARRQKRKPKAKPGGPENIPEHPEWENKDEEWSPDQPLLSDIRPQRPEERGRKLSGRAYVIGQLTQAPDNDYNNSVLRVGTEVFLTNAFKKGGSLHVDAETGYLYDFAGNRENDLLLRSFSYTHGGNRFSPLRWEAGRFQQHGVSEFGVLDGGEVGYRRENGQRFGVSMGYLPDWDDYDQPLDDFQIAAFFEWVSNLDEELTLTAGYQKTWHEGAPDRDLMIAKLRYVPKGPDGWDVFATLWIDFYTGKDDLKDGPEITQAQVFVTRRWASGNGIDVTYRHLRLPQLLRNEFIPLLEVGVDAYRYDRISVSGWRWMTDAVRATAEVVGWNDQNDSGASVEGGFDARDWFVEGSRTVLVVLASFARLEDIVGMRASFGRSFWGKGRWDLMYEFTFHAAEKYVNDRIDVSQHRIRVSASAHLDRGWDVAAHAEIFLYVETFWTLGFSLQKRF